MSWWFFAVGCPEAEHWDFRFNRKAILICGCAPHGALDTKTPFETNHNKTVTCRSHLAAVDVVFL